MLKFERVFRIFLVFPLLSRSPFLVDQNDKFNLSFQEYFFRGRNLSIYPRIYPRSPPQRDLARNRLSKLRVTARLSAPVEFYAKNSRVNKTQRSAVQKKRRKNLASAAPLVRTIVRRARERKGEGVINGGY